MRSTQWLVVSALVFSFYGCIGDVEEDQDVGRLGVALTMPLADVSEVRSFGLYALNVVEPEFDCDQYLANESDPISESSTEALVALYMFDVAQGQDNYPVSFRGVPEGRVSIIVEGYDSRGSRIFMGCGQCLVEAGRTTPLDITMVEDPGEM